MRFAASRKISLVSRPQNPKKRSPAMPEIKKLELNELLNRLWKKAIDTPEYNITEWEELEKRLTFLAQCHMHCEPGWREKITSKS